MKKIAVLTTTRADFGLLYWLIVAIHESSDFELQLVVGGTHLSEDFGFTVSEIIKLGIPIAAEINYLNKDNINNKSQQIAKATALCDETFDLLKPDLFVVLGDRYELLAFTNVAFLKGIPIAHIAGGEKTSGAIDDVVRHVVTKLSYWHFVSNEVYAHRVIQMGEDPARVFNVGLPSLEHLRKTPLMSLSELGESLNFPLSKPFMVLTYHPETWSNRSVIDDQARVLKAIEYFLADYQVIITYPNCDEKGHELIEELVNFKNRYSSSVCLIANLGYQRYLTALHFSESVVGNSSSGILEAATFKTPTVNIGDRQKGRIQSKTVVNVQNDGDIVFAIKSSLKLKKDITVDWNSPYGDGYTVEKIMNIFVKHKMNIETNKKEFFDMV